jgi:hypothetical protein
MYCIVLLSIELYGEHVFTQKNKIMKFDHSIVLHIAQHKVWSMLFHSETSIVLLLAPHTPPEFGATTNCQGSSTTSKSSLT